MPSASPATLRSHALATALGWLLFQPITAWATLSWQTHTIEMTAKPGAPETIGTFAFTNTGSTTVTILSVESSCGCTTAKLAKSSYAPGETGTITATFTHGDRLGRQDKHLYVDTDLSPRERTTLTFSVIIPERLTCSPRMLLWRTTEPTSPKTISVKAGPGETITALTPEAIAPDELTVKVETLTQGRDYRLSIQPTSLKRTANLPVRLSVRFADDSTQTITVYALIK